MVVDDLMAAIRAYGFPCDIIYTGGNCESLGVVLSEGGWKGQHALFGMMADELQYCDWGLMVLAHPADDGGFPLWVGDVEGCDCCAALYDVEGSAGFPDADTVDDVALWVVGLARRLARMVAHHP